MSTNPVWINRRILFSQEGAGAGKALAGVTGMRGVGIWDLSCGRRLFSRDAVSLVAALKAAK
jgi:hypothetical protein